MHIVKKRKLHEPFHQIFTAIAAQLKQQGVSFPTLHSIWEDQKEFDLALIRVEVNWEQIHYIARTYQSDFQKLGRYEELRLLVPEDLFMLSINQLVKIAGKNAVAMAAAYMVAQKSWITARDDPQYSGPHSDSVLKGILYPFYEALLYVMVVQRTGAYLPKQSYLLLLKEMIEERGTIRLTNPERLDQQLWQTHAADLADKLKWLDL